MKNFFKIAVLATGIFLLPPAQATDIRVLVYGEHAGTDIIYHYTIVNNGTGRMQSITIGSVNAGRSVPQAGLPPGVYRDIGTVRAFGQLTRLPTGTTFGPHPDPDLSHIEWPVLDPASITLPAVPAGWKAELWGRRDGIVYGLNLAAPEPRIQGNVNVTVSGADAGQTLSGFSVRVPAAAPGSAEPYYLASFKAEIWLGTNWFERIGEQSFGVIEKQDTLPPTLSVSVSPATLWPPNEKLIPITVTLTVKDDYDPQPEIKLESITANEPLDKDDIKDAKIGTDDRQFKLKAEREGKNKTGRIYTVTYSATDGTGNKATATATVTVPHDERKKDD